VVNRGRDEGCTVVKQRGEGRANLEGAEKALVDAHHGSSIIKLSAVVRRAEESDKLAFREELVTILDNLMGTADQVHVMLLEEARDDVRAKGEGYTTIVLAPSSDVLIWVGPEQIAEQAAVGNL
jgi:hypothetical protein